MSIIVFKTGLGFGKKIKKYLHTHVYKSIIYNSQNVEQCKSQLTDEWTSKIRHIHMQWKCLGFGKLLCSYTHSSALLLMNTFSSTSHIADSMPASRPLPLRGKRDWPFFCLYHILYMICLDSQIPGRLRIPFSVLSSHFKYPSLVISPIRLINQ